MRETAEGREAERLAAKYDDLFVFGPAQADTSWHPPTRPCVTCHFYIPMYAGSISAPSLLPLSPRLRTSLMKFYSECFRLALLAVFCCCTHARTTFCFCFCFCFFFFVCVPKSCTKETLRTGSLPTRRTCGDRRCASGSTSWGFCRTTSRGRLTILSSWRS